MRPVGKCSAISLFLIETEIGLLHFLMCAAVRLGQRPRHNAVQPVRLPSTREGLLWLDRQHLATHCAPFGVQLERVTDFRLKIRLHPPFLDEMALCQRAPDLF